MQKRDFIQHAAIHFMPQLNWDLDEAIRYAERLWQRLGDRGYGDTKQTGPRDIVKAYDKLTPVMKTAFDLFWLAFDYKRGRDEAAATWLQMGELNKTEYDAIIASAKQAAEERKSLPECQVPIMAQGWLSKRRWLDAQASGTELNRKQQSEHQQHIRKITGDLAHAKQMADQTGDDYWADLADKLTEKLHQLRSQQYDN